MAAFYEGTMLCSISYNIILLCINFIIVFTFGVIASPHPTHTVVYPIIEVIVRVA